MVDPSGFDLDAPWVDLNPVQADEANLADLIHDFVIARVADCPPYLCADLATAVVEAGYRSNL